MTENVFRTCRSCKRRQPVYFATDGHGRIVEEPLGCGCEVKRNPVTGPKRCVDCPSSVGGRALRCEPCRKAALSESARRWRELHPEHATEIRSNENAQRREQRRTDGDEIRARDRARPRGQKNARRRKWIQENRERHLRYRREWKAKNPESVKRSQDKANAKRRQAARDYMHLYATKYVGIGCEPPECRTCGDEVPFDGLGRPRLDCPKCRARTGLAA